MQPLISFDRAVDYYDQTRGFPPGVAEQVAGTAAGMLAPNSAVIEVGIGTGRIAKPLAAMGYKIFGLDISIRISYIPANFRHQPQGTLYCRREQDGVIRIQHDTCPAVGQDVD